jgi:hypothetical protein
MLFNNADTKILMGATIGKDAEALAACVGNVITPKELLNLKEWEFFYFGFGDVLLGKLPLVKPAKQKIIIDKNCGDGVKDGYYSIETGKERIVKSVRLADLSKLWRRPKKSAGDNGVKGGDRANLL